MWTACDDAAGGSVGCFCADCDGEVPSGGDAITDVGISDSTALGKSLFFENKPIATAPSIHFLARAEPCRACFSMPHSPAHAAFPCTTSANPLRLKLISAFGARITTGSPKLIAAMAFLKSLGIIQEIFSPSD